MDEVRKLLDVHERALLSDLWQDKDRLHALQSALSHRQLNLAQFSATMAPDFNFVLKNRGMIEEDKWVISFLKFNFDESEKARKQAEAQQVE